MMERRYRRSRSDGDRKAWMQQVKVMHNLYEDKRHQYWCTMIADNRGDMKKLWRTFSAVTGSRATSQSAGAGAGMYKAEDFAKFFNDKIAAVREDTKCAAPPEIKCTATEFLSSWVGFVEFNVPLDT